MEGKIYKAITATMRDIGAVGKNDVNEYDRYKFRGIDAVMNALNPAMIKNGIFVIPEVKACSREEREGQKGNRMMYTVLTVSYKFFADDGSFVEATVIGEAMDRSDKSTNKAMSAAFKYACFQTFCIPTEELLEDADKESPEIGHKASQKPREATPESKVDNLPSEEQKALREPMNDAERALIEQMCEKLEWDPAKVFTGWPNLTKEQYGVAMQEIRKRHANKGKNQ